jgi:hypothetical protein
MAHHKDKLPQADSATSLTWSDGQRGFPTKTSGRELGKSPSSKRSRKGNEDGSATRCEITRHVSPLSGTPREKVKWADQDRSGGGVRTLKPGRPECHGPSRRGRPRTKWDGGVWLQPYVTWGIKRKKLTWAFSSGELKQYTVKSRIIATQFITIFAIMPHFLRNIFPITGYLNFPL